MTNCGCSPDWVNEGQGCVVGGGEFKREALNCSNYWGPTDVASSRPECKLPHMADRSCVANLTTKIPGDDSAYIMDVFEEFLVCGLCGSATHI